MKLINAFFIINSVLLQSCTQTAGKINPTVAEFPDRIIDNMGENQPRIRFEVKQYQLIKSYRELVAITPTGNTFGKEVQRLADLELEASMDNKLSDNPEVIKQGEQESDLAIKRYQQYLKNYPDRPDNDLIIYQLARAYALESKPDQSQVLMNQLASQFPQSRYIDEIQFRRGENFFVEGAFVKAEQAYADVIHNHPDSLYYEKSLYKHGWSQFKQNRYKSAIDSYIKLLDLKQLQNFINEDRLADSLSRAEKELIEDVLRVTSLSFSYLSAKQPISQYFNHAGKRSYEPLLYTTLAELYLNKERITDATDIYLSYGENYPFSNFTPVFHGRAIDTFKQFGFVSLLLPEKEIYVKKYNKGSAFWNQQDTSTQAKLQPALTEHIVDIATHYHATARASRKASDFIKSANWYQQYLTSFPLAKNAAEINFLLAESHFDAKQFQQAIIEYNKTAYHYPAHKNSAEAGYALLISHNKLLTQVTKKKRPTVNQQLIQDSLRFSENFPEDKRMPAVLLKTAEQFFDLKNYAQSKTVAERLINNPITKPTIKHDAWVLIAHSSFELADYSNAEKAYTRILTGLPVKKGKDTQNKKLIQEQLALSIYKQGEFERKLGNHQQAATHFLRLKNIVPSSQKRVIADYDAATEYMTLEQWPTAIALLKTFRKAYPKQSKWKKGVTEKLALAFNNSGKYAKAAVEITGLIKLTARKQQRDLLWQVAELYHLAGEQKKAISTYKNYIKKYPYPISRSIELRYKIAEYYAQQKQIKKRYYWLNEIIKTDAKAKNQRSDRSRYLAAIASLELISPVHKKYSQASLSIPLKKSLKIKKKLMKQTIAAYTKAAKYQVEEVTTAVTFNIAEIYREFASALLNSERPKKLNEEELEEYNYLLEDQAYPFEEKAITIHQTNLSRISKGSFDDSIKNSLKALGKLMPFRYAKTELTDHHAE